MTTTRPRHATSAVRAPRCESSPAEQATAGHRRTALLAVTALLLGACSAAASAGDDMTSRTPVDVATADDAIGWDDDDTHLVVSTVNEPGGPAGDAAAGAIGESETDDGSAPLVLETPSGRRVLDGPPPGLLPVEANGPVERAAVAAEPGSFVAVDVDGEIGVPGERYLRTLTTITALDTTGPIAPDSEPDGGEVFAELDQIDPNMDAPAPPSDALDGAIAIQLGDGQSDAAIVEEIAALDGVVDAEIVGSGIIAVSVEAGSVAPDLANGPAAVIAEIDGVTSVNEDLLAYVSDDARQGEQWALENTGSPDQAAGWPGVAGADIRADEAWNVTTGDGIVVAVIDSGQDLAHRDLATNTWSNPGEVCGNRIDDDANGYIDDCQGWDFGAGDNNPTYPSSSNGSHGTHVAGIIAAARNGVGVVGAMPDAILMPLKVAQENGAIPMSAVAAAINYAADNGAAVINLSLGTPPGSSLGSNSPTELAIRHARERGVTVVVASGNDSADLDSTGPGWPAGFAATYDNVVAVGASTNSDTHAYFSNTGSIVGLHAPGWAVLSTMPGNTDDMKWGTSMAAPYVAAGAAGVIASGQATTPADVIARLRSTTVDLGWGRRLDLAAAVGYVPPLEGAALAVTVAGADGVAADTPAALDWNIQAPPDTTAAGGIRLSVAARHEGVISAVDGLEIAFSDEAGPLGVGVSDEAGEFPVIPIRDAESLIGDGLALNATMTLPATEYAFVVELVDDGGDALSAPHATFISVPGPPDTDPESPTTAPGATTTTVAPAPPTTAPPGSAGPVPPSSVPTATGPTTTAPSGGGNTPPLAPATTTTTTTPPGGSGGGSTPVTTAPVTTAPVTTTPVGGQPAPTTLPPDGSDGRGQPPTATTVPTTTTPSPTPTTVAPGQPGTPTTTTAPSAAPTTSPAGTPPNDPPPDPSRDGAYRADSITPASGPVDGFTRVSIAGDFPTFVPVYVWFGDQPTAVVRATATPTLLTLDTPAVDSSGIRDVIVRFTTTRSYELRLTDAFEYTPSGIGGTPPSTEPSSPPANPPASEPGVTTTTTTTAPSPSPTTSTTTTTTPSSPAPAPGPTTTTTTPSNTPPSNGGPSEPTPDRQLGDLTLRRQPTSGALSRLTTSSWPSTGCRSAVCPATRV